MVAFVFHFVFGVDAGEIVATASSGGDQFSAQAAVDGHFGTRWGSDYSDPQWIMLDLGQVSRLTGVILHWEVAYAYAYDIQLSVDGEQWDTVFSTTTGDGGVDDVSFPPANARFLRVYCRHRGTQFGYSIFEIDIKTADNPWGTYQPADFFAPLDWSFRTDPDADAHKRWAFEPLSSDWASIHVGESWEQQGYADYRGVAWYRKDVFIPQSWKDARSYIRLMDIQESYVLFVNGRRVAWGETKDGSKSILLARILKYDAVNSFVLRVTGRSGQDGVLGRVLIARSSDAFRQSMNTLRQKDSKGYYKLSAQLAPKGYYPYWLTDVQGYWTVVGVENDQKESLFCQDGTVEIYKSFSVTPFLTVNGSFLTREDVELLQELEQGYLPLPRVTWRTTNVTMDIDAFSWGPVGKSTTYVSYTIRNDSSESVSGWISLAIRPFEVNPPWQWGGFNRIDHLGIDSNQVISANEYRIMPLSNPMRFGVADPEDGDIVNLLSRGKLPKGQDLNHPAGQASGVIAYPFKLEPKESKTVSIALPLHPESVPNKDVAEVRQECSDYWENRLSCIDPLLAVKNTLSRGPISNISPDKIKNTVKANLAYILINKDGPAIQPGSRSYEASWIRDGAVTAKALLRCGFTNEVRDYINWYSSYIFKDGRVPAIVIHNRNEVNPVKEYDSQGEFIDVIWNYYQYTGDKGLVEKQWPNIIRSLQYLEEIRDSEVQDFYLEHDDQHRYYGILPKSVSHEGYYPEPGNHSYWDDFWGLKGWKDAIELAEAIGQTNKLAWMQQEESELRYAVYASISNTMAFYNIDYLPGCAELGDFDAASTAGAIVLCDELDALPGDAVTNSFRRYCEEVDRRLQPGWTGSFTPYEVRIVPALLALGWQDEAAKVMKMLLDHQHPAGWHQWPEAVYVPADQRGYIGDMPHTWISAGFINTCLDMLQNGSEIRDDNWLYVNNEKFYIKGVCFFENHTVEGQFERSSLEVMDYEFRKIKEAGFNTIRSQLRPEEIALANSYGLMVMQGANYLCFSSDYQNPELTARTIEQTQQISAYSKMHDNILCMGVDNEPVVMEGIYQQGEDVYQNFLGKLTAEVRAELPDTPVCMMNFPPGGFLDQSGFDLACLNLYPWYPSETAAGYGDYAAWYKQHHAAGKPLVISEYGWAIPQGEEHLDRMMVQLLDEQIRAGACGGMFFTWRSFGVEGERDHSWYGVVPNFEKKEDYKNQPRPLFNTLQRYFEVVIINPVKYGAYSQQMPVEIYGSDKTHSMTIELGAETYPLQRKGQYWWVGIIPLQDFNAGPYTMSVSAMDEMDVLLTRKTIDVLVNQKKKQLIFSVEGPQGVLHAGDTYQAVVKLHDEDGYPISDQDIQLLVNQTGKDLFMGDHLPAKTDDKGEYHFSQENILPGYFTLMAGLGMTDRYHDSHMALDIQRIAQ